MNITPRLEALIEYLVTADPKAVNKLAYQNGYPAPADRSSAEGFLATMLEDDGDAGLDQIMALHPDYEYIAAMSKNNRNGFVNDEKLNPANGFNGYVNNGYNNKSNCYGNPNCGCSNYGGQSYLDGNPVNQAVNTINTSVSKITGTEAFLFTIIVIGLYLVFKDK